MSQNNTTKKDSSEKSKIQNQSFQKISSWFFSNKKVILIVAVMFVGVGLVATLVYFETSTKNQSTASNSNQTEMENLSEQVVENSGEENSSETEELEGEEQGDQSEINFEEDGVEGQEVVFDNSTALAFQINFEEVSSTTSKVQSAESKRIAEEERKAAEEEARRLAASRRYVSHNNTSDLSQYSGKKIVLFMNADWCPYCESLDATLQAEKGGIPSNVIIVKVGYRSPLASNYDFRGIPTLFQVRSNGSLIKKLDYAYNLDTIINQI